MLRIHFTPRDLARVTVATKPAPLWEVLLSLHMLQHSDGRLIFEDWRRQVRARVAPDQMRLLLELTPVGRELIDGVIARRRFAIEEILHRMPAGHRRELGTALAHFAAAGGEPRPQDLWTLGWIS